MKTPKDPEEKFYSISEAARLTGYDAETLRFYEREGLLPGVRRQGGRRRYSAENLRAIGMITCLKKTGMPLKEIRRYFALVAGGDRTIPERLALMRQQEAAIHQQLQETKAFAERIAFKVWYYETARKEGSAKLGDHETLLARYRRETGRKIAF